MMDVLMAVAVCTATYIVGKSVYDALLWVFNKILDKVLGPPSLAQEYEDSSRRDDKKSIGFVGRGDE